VRGGRQGRADAQRSLGGCYGNGKGVAQDHEAALRWFRKAAAQGHAAAQQKVGTCYEHGEGVDMDLRQLLSC